MRFRCLLSSMLPSLVEGMGSVGRIPPKRPGGETPPNKPVQVERESWLGLLNLGAMSVVDPSILIRGPPQVEPEVS